MMKNLLLTWIILLGIISLGFSQGQKTLVKTLAVENGYNKVHFAIDGNIEVQEWDDKTIRIIATINSNVDDQILKALIKAGRFDYDVNFNVQKGDFIVDMPKRDKVIVINGEKLEDSLILKVYLPKGMKYELQNTKAPMLM